MLIFLHSLENQIKFGESKITSIGTTNQHILLYEYMICDPRSQVTVKMIGPMAVPFFEPLVCKHLISWA